MQNIKVHFVCNGNVFRSRLAEIYAKSLQVPGISFSSSGIVADRYQSLESPSPLVTKVLNGSGLKASDSPVRTQTTTELLAEQDIIIFMNDTVQHAASGFLKFNDAQAKHWHVKDWRDLGGTAATLRSKAAALFAQTTLRHITRSVDRLVRDITAVSWVDVCDVNDQPLGYRLPISWVNKNKTMWHRGVHVFVTTPSGYVIEKRAARIMFSPNLLDISVGGGVDSGETPLAAALREVHEELGVVATDAQIRLLEVSKWATYHPRYKRYSRVHLSTYHLALASDAEFTLQQGEVAEVRVVKPRKVQVLLRTHSLRGFGRLAQAYKYYSRIVQKIEAGS